ncbi:ferrochelatase [Caballeronia glathei]|uniref:Ferrochelatase n=1 Tax=Caballeronia glathei TaxID=60547 RepID=A0A069PJ64_9BURK|nr:ferrochelatase [Caballeronia glathei]
MFFEAERLRFFRPLNSSRRELIAACLRALYERLHGPAADYAHNLTRDVLRELLLPVVRRYQTTMADEGATDEFAGADVNDPQTLVAMVIRALLADGWLEQFADRTGLVMAFRFSRPGKLFAEALWALDRPSRSRQRNMRGCRNALEAALSDRGDAHDLVDAYEYAEKVIEDLTDGIDYFQELVRNLMQTASAHTQWNEFVEFLDRFGRDYARRNLKIGCLAAKQYLLTFGETSTSLECASSPRCGIPFSS